MPTTTVITTATMDSLAMAIKCCTRCELSKRCTAPVPYRWHGTPQEAPINVMLIGEAPGITEDAVGEPFRGLSGKLLDKWLAIMDVRSAIIGNATCCFPTGNEGNTPTKENEDACRPHLQAAIDTLQPKVILAIGRHAERSLQLVRYGGSIIFLRHPAYFLRNGGKGWLDQVLLAKENVERVLRGS